MPRIGTDDRNAELAVVLFNELVATNNWAVDQAWLAIAKLLMTCQVWEDGAWRPFGDFPVLMERNNYRPGRRGDPSRSARDAMAVGDRLVSELGLTGRAALCSQLGIFFQHPQLHGLQPNNPRGHAFRSLVAATIAKFGDPELVIREECSPHVMFPGFRFENRSEHASIDIVALRDGIAVALISTRWTYRHDRVDLIDEARAYIPAARSVNGKCVYYGVTAEFGAARLKKVIRQTEAVQRHAALRRLVHIKAELPSVVIGNNGELSYLMSLDEMVRESFDWRV